MSYDPVSVAFFDIAHEGARIRAVADLVGQGVLANLQGSHPRSIVMIACDSIVEAGARLGVAVTAPHNQPVLITDTLPPYVGPLDVVVVCSSAPLLQAHDAIFGATSRGATVIIVTEACGEEACEVPASAVVVPALPTTGETTVARCAAAVVAAVMSAELPAQFVADTLHGVADAVDREMVKLSPQRDRSVNPAALLAELYTTTRPVMTAQDGVGMAVAHAAAVLCAQEGIVCSCGSWEDTLRIAARSARSRDIFADPVEDPTVAVLPLGIVAWGVSLAGDMHAQVSDDPGMAGAFALAARAGAAVVHTTLSHD